MKSKKVKFSNFDINKFASEILNFAEKIMDPNYAIAIVNELENGPEYNEQYDYKDYLREIKDNDVSLVFIYSDANVGQPILCANGDIYEEDEEEDEKDFPIGGEECLGILLQREAEDLIISSVVLYPGSCNFGPEVILEEDCGVFNRGIEEFVNRFII